jgi:hypothetical protein
MQQIMADQSGDLLSAACPRGVAHRRRSDVVEQPLTEFDL